MKENYIKINKELSFNHIDDDTLLDNLNQISQTSSPGKSNLPIKIILAAKSKLVPFLSKLFNDCITSKTKPIEWKCAVVTPLFKKGDKLDLNNSRGISVISAIAKLFEKIIAKQISAYFENNSLFFDGQHGFRRGLSCESALHEVQH